MSPMPECATLVGRMTFAVAEDVIRQDFKFKLPSKTFIQLWNTPEIS
jgi:hypothetical protein